MSRESKLIKNMFILGIGTLVPRAAVLITLPIYTEVLTKAEMGTYELINSLVLLIIPAASLLLQYAAFRFLVECRNNGEENAANRIISNLYCFISVTSLISVCILFFFLPAVSFQIRIQICVFLFLETMLHATKEAVRGLGDNKAYTICSVIQAVVNVIFTIALLLFMKMGLTGVLISLNTAIIFALLSVVIRVRIYKYIGFKFFDKNLLKEMLKYSVPLIPNIISIQIMGSTGRFLASAYIGIEATAVFGVAYRLPVLVSLVYSAFNMSWVESAFETYADKDSDKYFSSVFNNLFTILSGLTAVLIVSTPVLFAILIRGDYDEAYSHIPILFTAVFIHCLASCLSAIYSSEKKTWGVGIGSGIGAAVNLIICFALIRHIGLYAASFGMLTGYIAVFAHHAIRTRKWKKIDYNFRRMIICIICLAAICVLCYQRLLVTDIINAAVGVVFACAVNRVVIITVIDKIKHQYKHYKERRSEL